MKSRALERGNANWTKRVVLGGLGTAGASIALAALAASAFANAANPTSASATVSTPDSNGHVTVTVSGRWSWGELAGVQTSPQNNCAGRSGVGWSVDWWGMSNSPTPAGPGPISGSVVSAATSKTSGPVPGTATPLTATGTWQIKSGASAGLYFHTSHQFNGFDSNLCAEKDGNGDPVGDYSATAVYASASDVPAKLCVNFYDPHGSQNNYSTSAGDNYADLAKDNSITTNSFDPANVQGNCAVPQQQNALSISVVKTNDANQDTTFTQSEQANSLTQNVNFKVVVTNNSPNDTAVIDNGITDTFGGTTITVCDGSTVGDVVADTNIVGTELAPKTGSVTCSFTLKNYVPTSGSKLNTVTVKAHDKQAPNLTDTKTGTSTVTAPNPGQSLAANIYQCVNGQPTSIAANPTGTISETAGTTPLTSGPSISKTSVAVDNYSLHATIPFGYELVQCGSSVGTPTDKTVAVPAGKDIVVNFYVQPAGSPNIVYGKTGPSTGLAGGTGDYTITLTNTGGATAPGSLSFVDVLPVGETFNSVQSVSDPAGSTTSPGMSCTAGAVTASGQLVTCSYANDLAKNTSVTVVIRANFAAGTEGQTLRDCTGNTQDTANVCWNTHIPGAPSITVVKTNDADGDGVFHDSEQASAQGDAVTFKVVVTNTSAGAITIDSVSDVWPGTNALAECPQLIGAVLQSGDSVTCTFTVDNYAPAAGDALTNTITVDGHQTNGGTPVTDTDTSTVTTKTPSDIDLKIVKGADKDTVKEGQTLTYTLAVSNVGTTATTGPVTVTDTVPDGLDPVSVDGGSAWACTLAGRDISCTYLNGPLNPGDVAPLITVVTTVNSTAVVRVVNTGVVDTPGDVNPFNNRSTVKTPVIKVLPIKVVKPPATPQVLPFTGDRTGSLLPVGVLAVVAGLLLMFAGRRRRTSSV